MHGAVRGWTPSIAPAASSTASDPAIRQGSPVQTRSPGLGGGVSSSLTISKWA
jgi:hypothetical protein